MFDYPSVNAVVDYMVALMLKAATVAAAGAAGASTQAVRHVMDPELAVQDPELAIDQAPPYWEARRRHLAVLAVSVRSLMEEKDAFVAQVRRRALLSPELEYKR